MASLVLGGRIGLTWWESETDSGDLTLTGKVINGGRRCWIDVVSGSVVACG